MKKQSNAQKRKANRWNRLRHLIREYAQAAIQESWKGGGDPADVEVLEARLTLCRAELSAYIAVLEREE